MALTNEVILNWVRDNASTDFRERIGSATNVNFKEIGSVITSYPTFRNEFVEILTNVIGRQIFRTKVYENKLKMFLGQPLEYGRSIEEIFSDIIKGKDYDGHYGSNTNDVEDLLNVEDPNVKVSYHTQNYKKQYKISISDLQLQGAFRNENGLNNLINQMLIAPLNSIQYDQQLMIHTAIENAQYHEVNLGSKPTDNTGVKKLVEEIQTWIEQLGFLSNKYNAQKVYTHSNKDELCIVLTPRLKALINVELLAQAFNVDKAEMNARIIVVENFVDSDRICCLVDKDFIKLVPTIQNSESIRVPNKMTTNTFFNEWGLCYQCDFVNAIDFRVKASVNPA